MMVMVMMGMGGQIPPIALLLLLVVLLVWPKREVDAPTAELNLLLLLLLLLVVMGESSVVDVWAGLLLVGVGVLGHRHGQRKGWRGGQDGLRLLLLLGVVVVVVRCVGEEGGGGLGAGCRRGGGRAVGSRRRGLGPCGGVVRAAAEVAGGSEEGGAAAGVVGAGEHVVELQGGGRGLQGRLAVRVGVLVGAEAGRQHGRRGVLRGEERSRVELGGEVVHVVPRGGDPWQHGGCSGGRGPRGGQVGVSALGGHGSGLLLVVGLCIFVAAVPHNHVIRCDKDLGGGI